MRVHASALGPSVVSDSIALWRTSGSSSPSATDTAARASSPATAA
jgi:hypothetical protein